MKSIIENWQGNDADLLATLNAKNEFVADNTYWTTRKIAELLTDEEYQAFSTVVRQFASASYKVADAFDTLKTTGLPFSDLQVRGLVQQVGLVAQLSQEKIDALLALGGVYRSEAGKALGRDATSDDITQVRFEIACDEARAEVKRRNDAADDAAREAIRQMKTYAEIIAAASNAWGA